MTPSPTSPRYILVLLSALGVFSSAVLLGTVFLLAGKMNEAASARAYDLVSLTLRERQEALEASVEDYAYWTLAYTSVVSQRADDITEHIGSGATESDLFDHLYIVSAQGRLLHSYGPDAAYPQLPLEALRPYIDAAAASDPADYASVNGTLAARPYRAAVTAAAITPDDLGLLEQTPAPLLVGVTFFDDAFFSNLEAHSAARVFHVAPAGAAPDRDGLALRGLDGTAHSYLTWQTERHGTQVLMGILPGILLTCAGILGLCLCAARYFHVQSRQFREATQLARTDTLTKVLNRAGLSDIVTSAAFRHALAQQTVALLYMDMDGFKDLNDAHGHDVGDAALKVVAQRLKASVRRGDHVVRMGGDEFVCLIVDDAPAQAARRVAGRLEAYLSTPFELLGRRVMLRASVGIAIGRADQSWCDLLQQADAAMYAAKDAAAPARPAHIKVLDLAGAQPAR